MDSDGSFTESLRKEALSANPSDETDNRNNKMRNSADSTDEVSQARTPSSASNSNQRLIREFQTLLPERSSFLDRESREPFILELPCRQMLLSTTELLLFEEELRGKVVSWR